MPGSLGRGGADEHGHRGGEPRDIQIIKAMQRGDSGAFEAYIERFHRMLLDYARRGGVTGADGDQLVEDVLQDVAIGFMRPGVALPRNPRTYLLGAFRNKLLNVKRARGRRERAVRDAIDDAGAANSGNRDAELLAGCSEGMVREARGPGWESTALAPMLERLAEKMGERLSDDERLLLDAVAENVPQREIAEWLGVSHVVARKRLERLRARLTEVAMRFATSLPPDEARELQRFFRRARARIGASASADHEAGTRTDGERDGALQQDDWRRNS